LLPEIKACRQALDKCHASRSSNEAGRRWFVR
jgi:hypothetical protein